jgi:hypothetical protein
MSTTISKEATPSQHIRTKGLRIISALACGTWMYSLLFCIYVSLRVFVNRVPIHDPFIWNVPFFTFYITGICMFVIFLSSMGVYLAIRAYSKPLQHVNRKVKLLSIPIFIIWMFSFFIWLSISSMIVYRPEMMTILLFESAPNFPLWKMGIGMFVFSFIFLVTYIALRNPFEPRHASIVR